MIQTADVIWWAQILHSKEKSVNGEKSLCISYRISSSEKHAFENIVRVCTENNDESSSHQNRQYKATTAKLLVFLYAWPNTKWHPELMLLPH